ncbi:MAG: Sec-independent protein translocase subunit TatA [Pseudomonadota bacterium]|jgi:sec-independent protein translocase protein TatA
MGLGGISIWQLLIILVIVMLIFGTKRLKNLGSDLGGAIRGFRNAMGDDKDKGGADATGQIETKTQTGEANPEAEHTADRKGP